MTRQWLADPELMCVPHRNAEHAETHMFVTKMLNSTSLQGYRDNSQFFGAKYLEFRHNLLTFYLPNHQTPIEITELMETKYPLVHPNYEDYSDSIITLMDRCDNCRIKMVERLGIKWSL